MARSDPKVSDENKSTVNVDDPRNWPWVVQQWECFREIKCIQNGPRERMPESVLRVILSHHYEMEPEKVAPRHLYDSKADLIHHYRAAEFVPQPPARRDVGAKCV
jgi:hypothetical protein